MNRVRARFAPSPTGYLHAGGARTALYNWLFARHHNGTFVLRIEDTDRARSTEEYRKAILEDLTWLGLLWDEGPPDDGPRGPYLQSQRGETYEPHIERLLSSGKAYHCFCTPEELALRRGNAPAGSRAWKYDRRCLNLSVEQRRAFLAGGRPSVVRFMVPEGVTVFDDMVLGTVEFDNSELDDLVIRRADGTPTYNFAVVVDDLLMGITHVIRGSDHLSNAPKQILMFLALGHRPPAYGHLPLVVDQDKQVLSKRRGAVAIGEYRKQGYVPEALVNYMALLGWSYDGAQEFFTTDELVEKFDLSRVSGKPAAFDPDKLAWMNMQWIKRLSIAERTDRAVPFLKAARLLDDETLNERRRWLEDVVAVVGDRLKTLSDIVEQAGFFLAPRITYDNIAVRKVLAEAGAREILTRAETTLAIVEAFDPQALEVAIRQLARELGLSAGKVIQPLRIAVAGKQTSPGIFETLSLLGRDRVLERLAMARRLAK